MRQARTEDADCVTLAIILHEELVTIEDMFGEVPRKPFVEKSGNAVEHRPDRARFDVGADAGLSDHVQVKKGLQKQKRPGTDDSFTW
jgi:hypothetical protein